MVSFSCEGCGDVLTKKKLDPHRNQCRGASFTCLDCMVHFHGTDYRSHTSCVSEAQKYQGALYKEKPGKNKAVKNQERAVIPRKAYVEDEADDGANVVAVVDVPPKAPSPPRVVENPAAGVDVFDFLVAEGPNASKALPQPGRTNGNAQDSHYSEHGYTYGDTPLQPSSNRYDSWTSLHDPAATNAAQNMPPPPYVTPGPKRAEREARSGEKSQSDKKRKRNQPEELDMARAQQTQDRTMTDAQPVLHSGLTGGLSRLLSRPSDDIEQQLAPSPSSPLKRSKKERSQHEEEQPVNGISRTTSSKRVTYDDTNGDSRGRDTTRSDSHDREHRRRHRRHRRHDSSSSDDHNRPSKKQLRTIEYKIGPSESASRDGDRQLVRHRTPADMFMSLVTKGPGSERGMSINKALKRYHRESDFKGKEGDSGDKDLWKNLRVRKNERGEIVLFV